MRGWFPLKFLSKSFPISILLLGACASYTQKTKEFRDFYTSHNYDKSLEALDKSDLKTDKSSRLLYLLERAMVYDRMGNLKESRQIFFEAVSVAQELYTTSITNTAKSFLINDSSQDYSGEFFELISIHTMLALSFIEEGDLDSAKVEANNINYKLHELTNKLGTKDNSYKEDAMARTLTGSIYEVIGQVDDAIIDYNRALELYESADFKKFYYGSRPPKELLQGLLRVASYRNRSDIISPVKERYPDDYNDFKKSKPGDATIIVIHETGHIAIKESKDFFLPIADQVVRFSFPYYNLRSGSSWSSGGTYVEADGDESRKTYSSNVVNLNSIAYQTLEDRRGRIIAKGIARLLLKGQINHQVEKNLGPLAGLIANIFTAVTETADTRSWTSLPSAFSISRLRLPAGKHAIKISSGGKLDKILNLDLRPEQAYLFRSK